MNNLIILLIGFLLALNSHYSDKFPTLHELKDSTHFKHNYADKCPYQYELSDSNELTHIKDIFYRNKTEHLYERTIGVKMVNGNLVDHEYFNGYFSQEVDPYTFQPLDGWYAIDKRNVYYYRPVSGGMQISKIEEADVNTFKIPDGHYNFAMDKNNFYDNGSVIEGFFPRDTKIKKDKNGKIIRLVSKTNRYDLR